MHVCSIVAAHISGAHYKNFVIALCHVYLYSIMYNRLSKEVFFLIEMVL